MLFTLVYEVAAISAPLLSWATWGMLPSTLLLLTSSIHKDGSKAGFP
jgi:hypothetical protein